MNFFTWNILKKRLGAVRYLMVDKAVPKRKKLLVLFGIFYLFLPFDLIPAVLFPVAWMDDLLLWIYIIWNLKEYLDKYWLGEKTVDIKSSLRGKNIIDEDKDEGSD
ncbi:MAG: DUF1232 domain-containing protein [Clostridiales Family XIII bacterium]|nr:DUF1232 domain-containing protein [Clostridiales Family XIII bacterium]